MNWGGGRERGRSGRPGRYLPARPCRYTRYNVKRRFQVLPINQTHDHQIHRIHRNTMVI